ncbi:MAG: PAS domain S-box protein [Rhodocyclaceae bacterium]|nr:PAS domain S-box protein [Rhodocyclaceae bacterium]
MPEVTRCLKSSLRQAIEAQTRGGIAQALVPMYIFDPDSLMILAANEAAQRLYGYSEAEFLRLNLYDIRPAEEIERTRQFVVGEKPDGLWFSGVWKHRTKQGRIFTVSAMGIKVVHRGKMAVLAILTDLTQTMRLPGSSAQAGNAMFPFAEQMDEVCWIRNLDDNRLIYLSPAFERVYGLPLAAGYADQNVVLPLVHPEDVDAVRRYSFRTSGEAARLEYRIRRPDGAERWLSSRSFPLEDAAGARIMAGIVEDITERKQAEQRRLAAVEEQRDALVREVHHRIKNSLQGVSGLLRRFAAAHPELAPPLAEAAGQVQSMAVVHGLRGRRLAGRVELCDLVRQVAANAESLMQARLAVEPLPHCDPCLVIREQDAVPLALVINELIFNAIKHGAGGGLPHLGLRIDPARARAELRVANSGRLPAGFDPAGSAGCGLELVAMLLPPQGARLDWSQAGGEVVAELRLEPPVLSSATGQPVEPSPGKSRSP